MDKRLQAKHVPEEPILHYLRDSKYCGSRTHWQGFAHSIPCPEWVPEKVLLAKMRAMAKKGYVTGCACGCRGDWEITREGAELIGRPLASP